MKLPSPAIVGVCCLTQVRKGCSQQREAKEIRPAVPGAQPQLHWHAHRRDYGADSTLYAVDVQSTQTCQEALVRY